MSVAEDNNYADIDRLLRRAETYIEEARDLALFKRGHFHCTFELGCYADRFAGLLEQITSQGDN